MAEHTKFESFVGHAILGSCLCGMSFLFFFIPILVITLIFTNEYVYEITITIATFVSVVSAVVIILLDKRKPKKEISS